MENRKGMALSFGLVALFMVMYGATPAAARKDNRKPGHAVSADQDNPAAEPGDNGGVDDSDKPGQGPKSKDENNGKGQGLPDNKPGRDRTPQPDSDEGNIENHGDHNSPDAEPGEQGEPEGAGEHKPPHTQPGEVTQPNEHNRIHGPENEGCCGKCGGNDPGEKPKPEMKPDKKPDKKPQENHGPKPDKKPEVKPEVKPGDKPRCPTDKGQKPQHGDQGKKPDSPPGMDQGKPGFDKGEHRENKGGQGNNGHKK